MGHYEEAQNLKETRRPTLQHQVMRCYKMNRRLTDQILHQQWTLTQLYASIDGIPLSDEEMKLLENFRNSQKNTSLYDPTNNDFEYCS